MITHTQFGSGSPNSPFSYLNWHLAFLWSSFSNYKLNSRKQEIIQITSKYTRKKKKKKKRLRVKNLPAMREAWVCLLGWEDSPGEGKERLPTPVFCPGEFHGLFSSWGHRVRYTEQLWLSLSQEIANTSSDSRRRQWHPTLVLLPGKSHRRRSLVGCHLWGRPELDTTETT